MKIELKRFTTNARLSQETIAFAADVWVNGKKVGHAENDGHGGNTLVHLDPAIRAAVEAYGKKSIPAEFSASTNGTEWIVDQLVEAEMKKRDEKKFARIDAKEKAHFTKHGFATARMRSGNTWRWFPFQPGSDPKTAAGEIAAKYKGSIDELVVL